MLGVKEQSTILESVKRKGIKNTLEEDIALIEATEAYLLSHLPEGMEEITCKHCGELRLLDKDGICEVCYPMLDTIIVDDWVMDISKAKAQLSKLTPHLLSAQAAREQERKEIGTYIYDTLPMGEVTAFDFVKWIKPICEKLQDGKALKEDKSSTSMKERKVNE